MTHESRYLLPNATAAAGVRLVALAALFDSWTFDHLERVGISPGQSVWEVGAGGTTVVNWMAAKLGVNGRVLATDIDLTWLDADASTASPAAGKPHTASTAQTAARRMEPAGPGVDADLSTGADSSSAEIEVRRHDVTVDDVPVGEFDLVHARLVLVHLASREPALANMVRALKPGGWLVIEDADPGIQPYAVLNPTTPDDHRANSIRRGFRTLLADRGADIEFGRRLPDLLTAAGLLDVEADAYFPVARSECCDLELATMAIIREQLVSNSIATDDEIDLHIEALVAGRLMLAQPPMITCWGRVPG